jgi:formylglycine-generating enzyme required for sulfatase activity
MMVQRSVILLLLLVLLVLVGCGDEFTEDEEKALKDLVKDKVVADAGSEKEIVWKKDGKEMVLISAGSFRMGDSKNEPEEWMESSRPVHTVQLDAFYIYNSTA